MSAPIEQKAVAGPAATLVFGYLSGLLIQIIPWLKDNLTPDQVQSLPVVIAFLFSLIAAYLAPHTSRPDLLQTIESVADQELGQPVTTVTAPVLQQPPPGSGPQAPPHA